jgi:hypothetical protein
MSNLLRNRSQGAHLKQPAPPYAPKQKKKDKVAVDQALCLGDDCGCSSSAAAYGLPGNSWDFKNGKALID